MIVSMVLFAVTTAVFAVAALIMKKALGQKLGRSVSESSTNTRRGREVPSRLQGTHEPAYCYNDCMRAHEHTDPDFPCSVACRVPDRSRF